MGQPTQPQLSPSDQAFLQQYLASQGGGSNSVAMPASQQWVMIKATKDMTPDPSAPVAPTGWMFVKNPGYAAPKPTAGQMVGSAETGYYLYDPDTKQVSLAVPAHTPNADEEMTKAIDRQTREGERNERQANQDAGHGYMTNVEYAKIASDAASQNLNQDQLTEKIREYDKTQGEATRQFDLKQKAQDARDAADILQTKASTAYTAAQTGQITAKLPGELSQQQATQAGTEATTAYTKVQADRLKQLMGLDVVPTVQAAPSATQLYQYQRDPRTGQVVQTGINPEFQPKTQTDVAARIGQIQSLMQQKSAEVQAKVNNQQLTPDQGLSEFNQWYAQNVTPQQQQLQAAQEEAQRTAAIAEATSRQQAYQTAVGAGTGATAAWTAGQVGRVGPNFDRSMQAAGQGKFYGPEFDNSVTYQAPDPSQGYQQAVMEALKNISPTAAAATGAPMPSYSAINIPNALSATQYMPGAGVPVGAAAPAAPVPAPTAAAPAPPTDDWYSQWQARQAADVLQQQQARPGIPPWLQSAPNFGTYSFPG